MDEKTPAGDAIAKALKPARTALSVLALCFVLQMVGRGLGDSFTVFLKPIAESFAWDRAEVVSVYSLTWLAGGLMAPLVGRLFDRSGPRLIYSLGLLLLGGSFLIASRAQALWQFQLSTGLCVGIGIALIGNVPSSILLGRWFGRRLPTAMAILYSATGVGTLMLLPASQVLIDRIGWRDAYQWFGIVALCMLAPLLLLPWWTIATGSLHVAQQKAATSFVDNGWTLKSAMRHHTFWALFSTFFFTAVAMYAVTAQIVAYLIDADSSIAGCHRVGIFRRSLVVRHARHIDAGRHHRPSAIRAVQLRRFDRRHHPALAAAILSELLVADGLCRLLRQHDRFARAPDHRDRAEYFSRRTCRHHLRHHLDRSGLGSGLGSWTGGLIHDFRTHSYNALFILALINLVLGLIPFLVVPALRR